MRILLIVVRGKACLGGQKLTRCKVAGSVSIINVCWLNSWGKLLSGLVIKWMSGRCWVSWELVVSSSK